MRVSSVRRVRLISFLRNSTNGCDHTSTNAPDPIRTLQSNVLGESSTRMGDLQRSPRVAPLVLLFLFIFLPLLLLLLFFGPVRGRLFPARTR
jgi:hypothetical protein